MSETIRVRRDKLAEIIADLKEIKNSLERLSL